MYESEQETAHTDTETHARNYKTAAHDTQHSKLSIPYLAAPQDFWSNLHRQLAEVS